VINDWEVIFIIHVLDIEDPPFAFGIISIKELFSIFRLCGVELRWIIFLFPSIVPNKVIWESKRLWKFKKDKILLNI